MSNGNVSVSVPPLFALNAAHHLPEQRFRRLVDLLSFNLRGVLGFRLHFVASSHSQVAWTEEVCR